jgi:hypothetical protein
MATYRGMDGALSLGTPGVPVGEVFGWTVTTTLQVLEDTVMGDKWVTNKPGLGSWTATARARFDYGDATGQKLIVDAIMAPIPTGDLPIVNFIMDNDPKHITGAVIVQSVAITAEMPNIIEAAFSFTGNGPCLLTWS